MFHEILERLEQITVLLLLPVFFVITGLNVDITGLGDRRPRLPAPRPRSSPAPASSSAPPSPPAARACPTRQAMAIGVLMNTRGLTELVILTIGREVGRPQRGDVHDHGGDGRVHDGDHRAAAARPLPRRAGRSGRSTRPSASAPSRRRRSGCWSGPPRVTPARSSAALAAELTDGEEPREVALVQFGDARSTTSRSGAASRPWPPRSTPCTTSRPRVEASGVPVFARSRTTDDPGRLLGLLADENVADIVLVPEDPTYTPAGRQPGPGRARRPACSSPAQTTADGRRRRRTCRDGRTTCTPSTSGSGSPTARGDAAAGRPARPGGRSRPASSGCGPAATSATPRPARSASTVHAGEMHRRRGRRPHAGRLGAAGTTASSAWSALVDRLGQQASVPES